MFKALKIEFFHTFKKKNDPSLVIIDSIQNLQFNKFKNFFQIVNYSAFKTQVLKGDIFMA